MTFPVFLPEYIVEEYAGGVFGCGGLWKRLLRRKQAGLLCLYTVLNRRLKK